MPATAHASGAMRSVAIQPAAITRFSVSQTIARVTRKRPLLLSALVA